MNGTKILAAIGGLVIALPTVFVIVVAGAVWRAWWIFPAWNWFVMPLGAPAIPFWNFTALVVLISWLTSHMDTKKDERPTDWASMFIGLLMPMFTYAVLAWMHRR